MPVGDINSNEKGSGARFNDGKPRMDLLPISVLADLLDTADVGTPAQLACDALRMIGVFQKTHDFDCLHDAMRDLAGIEDPYVAAARVFEYGAKKYAAWNWAKGMAWSIPLACAVRHLKKIIEGEMVDAESGLSHVGHAACNIFMLLTYQDTYPEGNDLPGVFAPTTVTINLSKVQQEELERLTVTPMTPAKVVARLPEDLHAPLSDDDVRRLHPLADRITGHTDDYIVWYPGATPGRRYVKGEFYELVHRA